MPKRGGRRSRPEPLDLERYRSIIPDWDAFTACVSTPEPTVFRVRRGRVPEADVLERLHAQGFDTVPVEGLPAFHRVEDGPVPLSMTLEHWLGLVYVQQASTGTAAHVLQPRPGERVLDLCAAPGGKTTHLAELMEGRGCLVASEIDEKRIRGLLGNVYRLGHTNVLVVSGDGRAFPEGATFDRVLVDAPCSGEGTLRRRSGRAPDPSQSFRDYVTTAQAALLEKAVRACRPGGTILYSTCTFSPAENEAVVSAAVERLPVALEPTGLDVPHAPGVTSFDGLRFDPSLEMAARIYPHHLDSGGFFLAKLRRLDGAVEAEGAGVGGAGPDADGWGAVPDMFPDEGDPGPGDLAADRAADAWEALRARYGVDPGALSGHAWIMRGGRLWLHSVGEWPLPAWADGAWRPISVGIRAIEFDTRGRPRPTNDLLRFLGDAVTDGVVDVSATGMDRLLRRETVDAGAAPPGPVALRHGGDVLGRGAAHGGAVTSEIPKARAADLRRIRGRTGEG